MMIACPACATRYVVPDSAIGVEGRTVRCAKCQHSWFQAGFQPPPRNLPEQHAEPEPHSGATDFTALVAGPDAPASTQGDPFAARPTSPPPSVGMPRPVDPVAAYGEPTGRSPFAHEPPFRARRNPARMWTMAAVLFALLVASLIGAISWFGLPQSLAFAHPTFGATRRDLELSFPPEKQDRRTLPNKTQYWGASGTVTNVGKDVREVPPILIVLRDAHNRIVYTWNVIPPRDVLKPGESETINEAVSDVPATAKIAEIGWKPE